MKALVMGWFSFERADATAGDLLARDVVCDWLESAGHAYDVAMAPPFDGGVALDSVEPAEYTHVVFVCGPFFKTNLLRRFEGCRLVGVNLSMAEAVEEWNPFDLLLERDSTAASRPDVTFVAERRAVPAVGVTLIDPDDVPAHTDAYRSANRAVDELLAGREAAAVAIDTRLDVPNRGGLRTPGEVESLISRMDLVITTRLHGLVLAIKNGVPAIALDPVPGGGKLTRQAETIGWPLVFAPDVGLERLADAFEHCLSEEARAMALTCRERALAGVREEREAFIAAMRSEAPREQWGDGRRRGAWVEPGAAPPGRGTAGRLRAALRNGFRR